MDNNKNEGPYDCYQFSSCRLPLAEKQWKFPGLLDENICYRFEGLLSQVEKYWRRVNDEDQLECWITRTIWFL